MADPFSADQQIVDKAGRATAYFEDIIYGLSHIEIDAPSSASDAGEKGEIRADTSYLYVCGNTITLLRLAIGRCLFFGLGFNSKRGYRLCCQ